MRRPVPRSLCALGLAWVCSGTPARARADSPALEAPAVKPTREQIQQLHEGCQRHIDEDRAVEAAQCLEKVYAGLVATDSHATLDLYYVLTDAVNALQAAAAADPRDLCRADALLQDYQRRSPRLPARRYGGKVAALRRSITSALEQAKVEAQRDICAEEPPAAAETPASASEPQADEPAQAEPSEPVQAEPAPRVTDRMTATRPASMKRTTPRRQILQPRLPYTALLDASFGVTLAGVAGAGVGAALYIYGLECKDGPPRCSSPAPQGVRDAGLVLMSAGAATMIVGFGLRFADHRAARKAMRSLPAPAASPTALGLTWSGRF